MCVFRGMNTQCAYLIDCVYLEGWIPQGAIGGYTVHNPPAHSKFTLFIKYTLCIHPSCATTLVDIIKDARCAFGGMDTQCAFRGVCIWSDGYMV